MQLPMSQCLQSVFKVSSKCSCLWVNVFKRSCLWVSVVKCSCLWVLLIKYSCLLVSQCLQMQLPVSQCLQAAAVFKHSCLATHVGRTINPRLQLFFFFTYFVMNDVMLSPHTKLKSANLNWPHLCVYSTNLIPTKFSGHMTWPSLAQYYPYSFLQYTSQRHTFISYPVSRSSCLPQLCAPPPSLFSTGFTKLLGDKGTGVMCLAHS